MQAVLLYEKLPPSISYRSKQPASIGDRATDQSLANCVRDRFRSEADKPRPRHGGMLLLSV